MTKVDQLNQLVRSYCVILAITTFCLVFAYGVIIMRQAIIGTDAFAGVLGALLTWWFKARDDEKKDAVIAAAVAATVPPTPVANGGIRP